MKRSWIFSCIVVLVAIFAATYLVLIRSNPKPLTYQGKPIECWFAQLPVTPIPPPEAVFGNIRGFIKSTGQQYGSTDLLADSGIAAIEALGTNALPFLLARLQATDSVSERAVTKVATNAGVSYLPFRNADLERLQAVTGLIRLKTLTPEAQLLITSLQTHANPGIASAAAYILKRRDALDVLPISKP